MTTIQDLINDINTKLVPNGEDLIDDGDIRDPFLKVVDLLGQAQTKDIIPDYAPELTFQTDGSDDGRYCSHPDTNGKYRIWKTKVDNNTGNEPPTDPEITSDSNWEERSPSVNSVFNEWSAGIYGTGLVVVFWNHSIDGNNFYKLVEPTRPFESTNIETEIAAGKWVLITNKLLAVPGQPNRKAYPILWVDTATPSGQQDRNLFYGLEDAVIKVIIDVVAIKSDGSEAASFAMSATFRKDGSGTPVQVGTTKAVDPDIDDLVDVPSVTLSLAPSPNEHLIRVAYDSGSGDTYRWTIWGTIFQTVYTDI